MSGAVFEELFRNPVYLDFKNHLYNYRLRREAIRANLDPTLLPMLEVGAGVSPVLSAAADVIQSDISFLAMRHLLQQGSARNAVVFDADRIPFVSQSAGTIVCSEVLEHIPEDRLVLDEFARVLRPGGRLVLTVPTHRYFFSYDDRFVGHFRRYNVKELLNQLQSRGFHSFHVRIVTGLADKIGMLSASFAFGLISNLGRGQDSGPGRPPAWLKAILPIHGLVNRVYGGIARFEARIIPQCLATIVLISAQR